MSSSPTETSDHKETESEADSDPKPIVPLRQRRLPASFWQEPSAAPEASRPAQPLIPWGAAFLPQRLPSIPHPTPLWVRGYCNCAMCLNYAYLLPRFPDVYCGLRPRAAPLNAYCGAGAHCADQGCKLCTTTAGWHPERMRQARLRAARYNALLD